MQGQAALGDVTCTSSSESQTSEKELLSAEVSDRKEEVGLSKNQYVVSLIQQEADLKLLKWRLNSCLQRRIIDTTR